MAYTIENLTLKYDIKRLGSLFKALDKLAENSHVNQMENITSQDDEKIILYAIDMRSRINHMVKRIR
jgi:gamma-glutamylcyclotransferase (GGCT)/AIG2-like uncharacterized protein YtfP